MQVDAMSSIERLIQWGMHGSMSFESVPSKSDPRLRVTDNTRPDIQASIFDGLVALICHHNRNKRGVECDHERHPGNSLW